MVTRHRRHQNETYIRRRREIEKGESKVSRNFRSENSKGVETKFLLFLFVDPPGPATIVPGQQQRPLKGQSVTLTCHVNDTGLPATSTFRWEHGPTLLNVTGNTLITEPVTTATQGNYSCAAVNKVGAGHAAHWVLDALGTWLSRPGKLLFPFSFWSFLAWPSLSFPVDSKVRTKRK